MYFFFQAIWIFSLLDYKEPTYNRNSYFYPHWAIILGWCISATSLAPIPIVAIFKIITTKADSLWQVCIIISHNSKKKFEFEFPVHLKRELSSNNTISYFPVLWPLTYFAHRFGEIWSK